jgi:hypothetical protein
MRASYILFAYPCTQARVRPHSQGVKSPPFPVSCRPSRARLRSAHEPRLREGSRPMLLALGRFGVRARIHFLSRAASPAIAPSPPPRPRRRACRRSRTPSPALASSPSQEFEPRSFFSFAKRNHWDTHDSPWNVSPCRRPLPSPARFSCATAPCRPGVEYLTCHPKTQ